MNNVYVYFPDSLKCDAYVRLMSNLSVAHNNISYLILLS